MVELFSKNSNLCDHNSPTSQTDGQTTCDRNIALCTKVHRAVIKSLYEKQSIWLAKVKLNEFPGKDGKRAVWTYYSEKFAKPVASNDSREVADLSCRVPRMYIHCESKKNLATFLRPITLEILNLSLIHI